MKHSHALSFSPKPLFLRSGHRNDGLYILQKKKLSGYSTILLRTIPELLENCIDLRPSFQSYEASEKLSYKQRQIHKGLELEGTRKKMYDVKSIKLIKKSF